MGVWIETASFLASLFLIIVTPCVGVWIETWRNVLSCAPERCHTLRGCVDWNIYSISVPLGLPMSHPAWVCGLKRQLKQLFVSQHFVTPCVGVWIETLTDERIIAAWRHTLRGCVDWNFMPDYLNDLKFNQVTPCVGVWIETENQQKPYTTLWVTPCVGVWIETENILYDFLLS